MREKRLSFVLVIVLLLVFASPVSAQTLDVNRYGNDDIQLHGAIGLGQDTYRK